MVPIDSKSNWKIKIKNNTFNMDFNYSLTFHCDVKYSHIFTEFTNLGVILFIFDQNDIRKATVTGRDKIRKRYATHSIWSKGYALYCLKHGKLSQNPKNVSVVKSDLFFCLMKVFPNGRNEYDGEQLSIWNNLPNGRLSF